MIRYVGTLTTAPARMVRAGAESVFAARRDERALHDGIVVGAPFTFMNRMVDGRGLAASPESPAASARYRTVDAYAGVADPSRLVTGVAPGVGAAEG